MACGLMPCCLDGPTLRSMTTPTLAPNWRRPVCALALLCLALPAAAADRCAASADEAGLLRCRQAENQSAQRAVLQAIERLRQRYVDDEPERLKLLLAAQQAWRNFQQAECRFQTQESAGAPAHAVYLLSCQTALAGQRLKSLQAVLANP